MDGGGRLVIEAEDGLEWQRRDLRFIASGGAVAAQGDTTLRAERIEARYRESDEDVVITRIEGVGGVELSRDGITARAERIDYDLLADRAVLSGGASTITTEGESITATEKIDYDRGKREILAEGQVVVAIGDGRLLMADSVLATVNEAEDDFTFVHARGGAEVVARGPDGERRAIADEIEYTRDEDLVVLTGAVEIFDGGSSITGERAEIDLAKGTSRMTSRSGRVGGAFTSTP